MMRILVTGRQGQLVRSLIERGADTAFKIVALGRPELDLEDVDSIARAVRDAAPDLIISAAAYTNVDAAEDEPDRAQRVNADAAGALASAARAAGAPIIHLSTDYVFDGASKTPYREDDPTGPLGVYGRTKLDGERQVRMGTPDHAIVRTAWVYSPFDRNFVRTMMTLAQTRDALNVVADQRGNPTSALDLADGLLALAAAIMRGDDVLGQTYHLTGMGEASWFDFAAHVFARCEALGLPFARAQPIPTAEFPTKAVRPSYSMLDCSKFADATGFAMPDWRGSADAVVTRLGAPG